MLKRIVYIGFIIFLLVLIGRSFQYVYRIYVEFRYPEPDRISSVDVCGPKHLFFTSEEEWLYNYLKLGIICKK